MKYLIFLAFFLSLPLQAAKWKVNKDHSEILFSLPYLLVSEVTGRFTNFDGQVELDDREESFKDIILKIQADSIFTANKMRDTHLKRSDFFNVTKFPDIIFKSTKIQLKEKSTFIVQGDLNIRGLSFPETFEVELSEVVFDTWNKKSLFFKFKSLINFKKYGLTWNKTLAGEKFLIGETVSIHGVIQAQPFNEKTSGSKHRIPDTKSVREREKARRGEVEAVSSTILAKADKTNKVSYDHQEKPKEQSLRQAYQIEEGKDYSFKVKLSYYYLIFLAFLANVYLCLMIKNKLNDYFKEKYKENGLWGYTSDLLIFILSALYVVTSYYLTVEIL